VTPTVTFVVPCYKLAHLLPECIDSILSQTYRDFEILIMDDCSPDDTAEVARSFADPRVKHIRNEPNLGHLRNYNKGIGIARGEYIWLISADDRIRTPQALERYVRMMEENPNIGFVCCPAVEMRNGGETGLARYSVLAERDTVFKGHDFLKSLLYANVVVASSGMVRRVCYEEHGTFPLDLPYAGDWYLWLLFALHYDVGYVAEPMVNYRGHELSMTNRLMNRDIRILVRDWLAVLWPIKHQAEQARYRTIATKCEKALAYQYARFLTSLNHLQYQMDVRELDESVSQFARDPREAASVRARVYVSVGDIKFGGNEFVEADNFYKRGLGENPFILTAWVKRLLLHMGDFGIRIRDRRKTLRNARESDLLAKIQEHERAKSGIALKEI
jgi:glycosyltransferase involved in cell wall biosynthesis